MNFNFSKIKKYFFLIGLIFSQQTANAATPVDRIITVVNDDVITLNELEIYVIQMREQIRQQGKEFLNMADLQRYVLDILINEKIQLQMADRLNIKVDDKTLNKAIGRIAKNNNIQLTKLKEILEQEGLDYVSFVDNIHNQLKLTKLRQRHIGNRIVITDGEVDSFLSNLKLQGEIQAEVRLSHILFSLPEDVSADKKEQVRAFAEQTRNDLLAGADFAEVAKAVSEVNNAEKRVDLGWLKGDEIPNVFIGSVSQMKKGDISELIESPSGFHIVKITDIKDDEKNIIQQTKVRHILIKETPLSDEYDAKQKLEKILARIKNGDDFSTLAKGNSDDAVSAIKGGDLGWVSPGDLVLEFEDIMNSLQPGEISKPFESDFGWHIVQVLERRNKENKESSKRVKIRELLYKRKLKESLQNWENELREEAYIEYRLDDS